jgi:hypothetical protein
MSQCDGNQSINQSINHAQCRMRNGGINQLCNANKASHLLPHDLHDYCWGFSGGGIGGWVINEP